MKEPELAQQDELCNKGNYTQTVTRWSLCKFHCLNLQRRIHSTDLFAHTGSNCEPAVTGGLVLTVSICIPIQIYLRSADKHRRCWWTVLLMLAVQGRIWGKLWPPAFVSSVRCWILIQTREGAPLLTLLKETKQVQQEVNVFSTDFIRKEEKKISRITTMLVAMNQSKGNVFCSP